MPPIRWAGLVRVMAHGCELVLVRPDRMADAYRLFTAALHVWHGTADRRGWLDHPDTGILLPPATDPDDLKADT
jgi:uncharacterized protein (DUF2384 family)